MRWMTWRTEVFTTYKFGVSSHSHRQFLFILIKVIFLLTYSCLSATKWCKSTWMPSCELPIGCAFYHSDTFPVRFRSLRTKVMHLCILIKPKKGFLSLVCVRWVISLYLFWLVIAGVLNNTHTSLGRALMRLWLLRPSLSLDVIRARHDAVECFLKPENQPTSNTLHGHLKGIKNVPRMLGVLKTDRAKVPDWQGLLKVCHNLVAADRSLLYHHSLEKFTIICVLLKETLSELHSASHVEIVKKVRVRHKSFPLCRRCSSLFQLWTLPKSGISEQR
jgi:hypothetical protein